MAPQSTTASTPSSGSLHGDGSSTPQSTDGSPPSSVSGDVDLSADVAVIGMACRLPGGINNTQQLWDTMLAQKDHSGEIPKMRWEPYYARDPRNAKVLDKTTQRGYFLENCEHFDASFFGVSGKEAEQMDPQQRITLEVAWEALEHAGIPPKSLSGSDTAVFMGVNSDDYAKLLLEDLPNVDAWMGIGTAYCGVPNRISYHLNLMGPSTAVDAACASSLVAIHHGRQAILNNESKIAIVGGVNVLCGPGLTSVLDIAGATCPEGNCMSFDDKAHGYGRGEGAAIVILKRLSDAVRDNDNILGLLKGSAVAQDGRTNGIMAPNAKAQEIVARQALRCARLQPSSIQYVEAHATSTPLGDPTEVSAIASVYGSSRAVQDPVYVGSVKPNIGHLEAGAGAAGFIKAMLALGAGVLPPQANLETLNKKVDWEGSRVKVVQTATKWPATEEPRRAAICSYGYGGTVSHAVIEGLPPQLPKALGERSGPEVIVLSAPREDRLKAQAADLSSWLENPNTKIDIREVASTLACRRELHDFRVSVIANDAKEAAAALKKYAEGSSGPFTSSSRKFAASTSREAVWVFSGHGAQWPAMGKELLGNPVFKGVIDQLEPYVQEEMGLSIVQSLQNEDFAGSEKVQVLCYVMQVGLSAVLHSKGIKPTAVIGHSVGEIAASVEAGCLNIFEGAMIACRRAKLYKQVIGVGSMAMVQLPFHEVQETLAGRTDIVAAIDSSPSSCVVSGETAALEAYIAELQDKGMKPLRVKTDIPFHSPTLDRLVEPLVDALRDQIEPRDAHTTLYSTSDLDPRTKRPRDISYWTNNMIKPVFLTSAVRAAAEDGMVQFLEVSSHPIVSQSISETLMDVGIEEFSVEPTMLRNKPVLPTMLNTIGKLWSRGVDVEWQKIVGSEWEPAVPGTKWIHKPYWRAVQTGNTSAGTTHDPEKHTLLGQRHSMALSDNVMFTSRLDEANKPFPGNHPLHGTEIVPAAGLINTFHHATKAATLSNIILRVPVAISAPRDIQVVVQRDEIAICSRLVQADQDNNSSKSWITHTTGSWSLAQPQHQLLDVTIDIEAAKKRIGARLADNFSIDYLDKVGVSAMGFPWAITEHFGNLDEMVARVDVMPSLAENASLPWDANSWAPVLDAATSVGSTLFFDDPKLRMPASIDQVQFFDNAKPPRFGYLYVERDRKTEYSVHVTVTDEAGQSLVGFRSMRFSEIEGTPGSNSSVESLVHRIAWPPARLAENPIALESVVLVSKNKEACLKYQKQLVSQGSSVDIVDTADALRRLPNLGSAKKGHSAVVYIPSATPTLEEIPAAAEEHIAELLAITKFIVSRNQPHKVYVFTNCISAGGSYDALAQAPLQGLCRIIASEHPDAWGALIDVETDSLPAMAMRYVQGEDVVQMKDGIPRVARLRPMPRERLLASSSTKTTVPRPEGTYLITGGLGALGLEVADYLVEKGARRVVLISRRELPSRKHWSSETDSAKVAVFRKIEELEKRGAVIYAVSNDLGTDLTGSDLAAALDRLSLPPVLGVVHAAGVLEDQLVLETTPESFGRVLKPKVSGALALHTLFPPGTLDFFVMFSSCGQLFGFPGQSSYASGNAFLDTLATHRRAQGDNSVAMLWTSWHGMGMAASTDFISAELASKGITDVSRDDAFRAWEHIVRFDIDHGVVLRSLPLGHDEPLPANILADIVVRQGGSAAAETTESSAAATAVPVSGAGLEEALRSCVAEVLMCDLDEVDSRAALSDLGVDSVMTVTLRRAFQKKLKVKVPPTLTWSHPTIKHLTEWFAEKLSA